MVSTLEMLAELKVRPGYHALLTSNQQIRRQTSKLEVLFEPFINVGQTCPGSSSWLTSGGDFMQDGLHRRKVLLSQVYSGSARGLRSGDVGFKCLWCTPCIPSQDTQKLLHGDTGPRADNTGVTSSASILVSGVFSLYTLFPRNPFLPLPCSHHSLYPHPCLFGVGVCLL